MLLCKVITLTPNVFGDLTIIEALINVWPCFVLIPNFCSIDVFYVIQSMEPVAGRKRSTSDRVLAKYVILYFYYCFFIFIMIWMSFNRKRRDASANKVSHIKGGSLLFFVYSKSCKPMHKYGFRYT